MSTLKEMYKGIPNSPEATLTSDINSTQTTITVSDANIIPEVPNILVIGGNTDNPETVKVTGKNGNTLTVERGFQGSAQAWEAGTKISRNFTAYDYNTLVENINNLQQQHNEHKADGASHSKTARFVVGTSTAGWTLEDCDYLCDGTNDQEEIIRALNDLPATGGEVVILDGTYNITASINIPKDNVSIRGSGNATTLKRMYNSTNTDSGPTASGLITLNEKSGCKIQGLQIDGNKAIYTAGYNQGIYLYSSSNNTVTGNTCNNNIRGISLSSSSNNTVTSNTCYNNTDGIYLYSSSNNTVTGNTCYNNTDGISLTSSSNNTVTSNICNNNSYGIPLYLSSSDNTVTDNICYNNSTGIRLYSSSNNTATGNTCNNNNYGIYLSSSSNNTVTGNTCIRGIGTPEDYTTNQHTIFLSGTGNNYNLISSNNCMGKAPVVEGGTGNTVFNNKWNESSDFEDLRADVVAHKAEKATQDTLGHLRLQDIPVKSVNSKTGEVVIDVGDIAGLVSSRLALGYNADVAANYSVALGRDASATGSSSVALGRSASATGSSAVVALGNNARAAGNYSVALGNFAAALRDYSIALGNYTTVVGDYSVALGRNASAENANEGILGSTGSDKTSKWIVPGDFTVSGTKNFEIPHPKPEKSATHVIRHGAVESPTPGDTLYRWRVQATKDNDLVTIDLPDYFIYLNKDVQIWVTGQGHFGNGYGTLNRETEQLEIHCQFEGEYNVLVIGTRNDDHQSVQDWYIKGVEREIGESWTGETYAFSVDEIIEIEEIKEVSA